jgi:hypothetical protein
MDGFDFAAIFFVFATALAMTANNPREEGSCALTPLWAVPRKVRTPAVLDMKPLEQPKADQAVEN